METVAQQKIELRRRLFAQRLALTPAQVRAASLAIAERLEQVPEFRAANCLCAYVSTGQEVGTHGLIRQLLASGREVVVPVFRDRRYGVGRVQDFDADLRPGHWGILEPQSVRAGGVPDVWLVPGVAFDGHGYRLGHGKGYFDQLLAGQSGVKIGLAYDFQVVESVPVAAHDVRLDYIITENQTIKGT